MHEQTIPAGYTADSNQADNAATNPPDNNLSREWIRYGAWSGFAAAVLFMTVAIVPMPDRLAILIVLFYPLLLLVGHVGLYHFLMQHRPAFTTQLAVIFGIAAPVLVSAMLTVQQSLISYMERYYHPLDDAAKAAQINIWRAVDSVQLGLDVAWDMFILPTIILFSLGIMKHPAFGKVFGLIGLILGIGGLFLNIWTFPTPPIDVGLPDVGPFAMTWYAIMFGLMIRAQRKMQ